MTKQCEAHLLSPCTLTGGWFVCRFFHSLFFLIFSLSLSLFCALLISKQVRAGKQFPLWLTSIQPCRLVSRGCWERGAAGALTGDQISPEISAECHLEPQTWHIPIHKLRSHVPMFYKSLLEMHLPNLCWISVEDSPPWTKAVYRSGWSHRPCI